MLVYLTIREGRVAISKAERIIMSRMASKMTDGVCHESESVDAVKTNLNFATAFKKEYN